MAAFGMDRNGHRIRRHGRPAPRHRHFLADDRVVLRSCGGRNRAGRRTAGSPSSRSIIRWEHEKALLVRAMDRYGQGSHHVVDTGTGAARDTGVTVPFEAGSVAVGAVR
jgi:hypothetical protein